LNPVEAALLLHRCYCCGSTSTSRSSRQTPTQRSPLILLLLLPLLLLARIYLHLYLISNLREDAPARNGPLTQCQHQHGTRRRVWATIG
jgi:hypothetical protein